MTKRAKEYMNADFVYEDYKNLAEAQKIRWYSRSAGYQEPCFHEYVGTDTGIYGDP